MRTLYEHGVRGNPCARFARACPPQEGDSFTLPLLRGRAAEGGRGSLTHPLCILLLLLLLFAPSSFNENQLGHVVFHGHDGIRKWAADFAKKYVQLAYRIDYITRNEKSAQLTYAV